MNDHIRKTEIEEQRNAIKEELQMELKENPGLLDHYTQKYLSSSKVKARSHLKNLS